MRPSVLSPTSLFAGAAVCGVSLATAVAIFSPQMSVIAVFGVIAIVMLVYDPRKIIYLAILLLPFQNAPALTVDLFGIPGAKLLNIVLGAALVISFLDRPAGQHYDMIERRALIALGAYIAVFAIEFTRSIGNVQLFNMLMPGEFHADTLRYILSYFVRPALFVVPFVFILRNMVHETERVVRIIAVAIFLMSVTVMIGIIQDPAILGRGRDAMSDLCGQLLGMHYNSVGTVYITVGPLLIYLALHGGIFGKINLGLAFVMLMLLQSRSGLVAFAVAGVITLIALRRTVLLVALAVAGAIVLAVWQGPTTAALLSIGINEGAAHTVSLDDVFTGRIDGIWLPLLQQWATDPTLLVFGAGRYGILTSPLWLYGGIYQTTHAHNAFIDFFLDSGIVLTLVLVAAIIAWISWTWRIGRAMRSQLFWALFMCPVAYLMGTPTERQFYPGMDNVLVFPILAVTLNLIRVWASELEEEAGQCGMRKAGKDSPSDSHEVFVRRL